MNMKKLLPLLLILIPFFGLSQWSFLGPAGLSSGWSVNNKSAIDAEGNPVIAFISNSSANVLRYSNNRWNALPQIPFIINDIHELFIDQNNNYLLFINGDNSYPACIKFNGTSWSYVGSQYIESAVTGFFSAAIDKNGIPYCSYSIGSGQIFKFFNGTSWATLNNSTGVNNAAFLAMDFNTENDLCIAFWDLSDFKVKVFKHTETTWDQIGSSLHYGYTDKINLIGGNEGKLYITISGNNFTCHIWNSGTATWVSTNWSETTAFFQDMIVDRYGKIFIAAELGDIRPRCFSYDGNNWIQIGNEGIDESQAGYLRLAIDSSGYLLAAFNHWDIGKAVVKRFGTHSGTKVISKSTFKIYPNPADNNLIIERENASIYQNIQIYNYQGQMVVNEIFTYGLSKISIDTSILINGIYYLNSSGKEHFGKFVINH
jgi:hypothetical protein